MAGWQLGVLAGGQLQRGEKILSLERKTAALLSYLCLEGATSRSKLAGLLWPNSPESTARANLRQLLKRLREASGDDLMSAGDPLSISSELECDAAKLQVAAFLERHDQLGGLSGEFLSGYDYDDCPDFDDWRLATRDQLAMVRRELLMNALQRHEETGDYRSALSWAQQLLASDPLSEEAHRSVMRLQHLLGDRPAALKAYQRCKDILKRELGVEPLAETVALARAIDRGSVTPPPTNRARQPSIPLSVLRPPVLAGREIAWAQLEQAWEQGKPIFVSGESGIGKSRLISDFVASKGAFLLLEARPNDRHVPLSSHARYLRQMLQMTSDPLEPWIRSELSRLIPELSDIRPRSLNAEPDKLRLLEAEFTLAQRATRGLAAIVNDDLHYMDATSFEAGVNLAARLVAPWQEDGPRSLSAFRRGELAPVVEAELHQLLGADAAVLIELNPLDPLAVSEMLGGLELNSLDGLSDFFSHYTGGNPLFIVETVKSLFEAGTLGQALPKHLPPPGRVRTLLSQRLTRLSASALRLLQVAALADGAFAPTLARDILAIDAPQLTDAFAELEAAQMMSAGQFSHNLLLETVREELPLSVRTLLHGRIFEVLAATDASAALLAHHAQEAGLLREAFACSLRAGDDATRLFALRNAALHYDHARELALQQPLATTSELRRLYYQLGFAYIYLSEFALARTLYEDLLDTARRRGQLELEWLALNHLAYLAVHDGYDVARATQLGEEALAIAEHSGDQRLLIEAYQEFAGLYTLARRPEAAQPYAERALALARRLGDAELVGRSLLELELADWKLGRWEAALQHLGEARQLYARLGNRALEARSLHSLAFDRLAVGQATAAAEDAREALALSQQVDNRQEQVNAIGVLALVQLELGNYGAASAYAEESVTLVRQLDVPVLRVLSLRRLALVQLALHELAAADATLSEATALNEALPRKPRAGELAASRCKLALYQGDPEQAYLYALAASYGQDFASAEPWITRWPVIAALELKGAYSEARQLLADATPWAQISPRHRLEHLRMNIASERLNGKLSSTLTLLNEARQLAEALSLRGEEAQLLWELSQLQTQLGHHEEAAALQRQARELVQQLVLTLRDPHRQDNVLAGFFNKITPPSAV